MDVVRSKLLPVPHAFTTRDGGVSEGPYASLNVGLAVGDDRERVLENLRRVARRLEVSPARLYTVSQVHGDVILEGGPGASPDAIAPIIGEADAILATEAQSAAAVKTADCVPILIAAPDIQAVAAIHSGWKGTDHEIARRTVERLVAKGARAEHLIAAIGPCIQACCYEVSPDLGERFQAKFGSTVVRSDRPRPHLDLPRAVRQSLEGAGMRSAHIEVLQDCTACDPRFFSHRRDKGTTGRQLSVAVCRF